jgi:hypothetical protein
MEASLRLIGSAALLSAALAAGCPVWAADGGSAAPASWSVMSGRVTMVDPAANTLKVQSGLLQKTFVVDGETSISDGMRALGLRELVPGAEVEIEYQDTGGRLLSRSITLNGDDASNAADAAAADRTPETQSGGAMRPASAIDPSATQPGPGRRVEAPAAP